MIDREYVNRLVRASPVDFYVSGLDGARCFWPWRLVKAGGHAGMGSRKRHADQCDWLMVDSNFKDDSVTNEVVLDESAVLGADSAVLADVYHDMDATVDALIDGLQLDEGHQFDGTVILPLQAPHIECYEQVAPHAPDGVWWAIGGLKDATPSRKVQAARAFREHVGPDVHVHGLGFGVTDEMARYIRKEPTVLDSIDSATAVSNAVGELPGKQEKMTIVAAHATAERLDALRKLTPFAECDPITQVPAGQKQFATATDGGTMWEAHQ